MLRATPREPLPVGRTWDLIVEDVREKDSGAGMPYLKRIPLGVSAPLKLKWLGGFNPALDKPYIDAKFDVNLDPATVSRETVTVEPAAPNLKVRADEDDVILEGDFDLTKHYEVVVSPQVKGSRGYGLAAPERWGAHFRPSKARCISRRRG